MVRFFYGPNGYAIKSAVDALVLGAKKRFGDHAVERFDGETLEVGRLPEVLQGASLFTPQRLVIIRDASKNKPLWEALGEKVGVLPETLDLVVVETAPDKRTKTFKALQKQAETVEAKDLNEFEAAKWLTQEAKQRGGELSQVLAKRTVERAGTDQFRLSGELDKLLLQENTSEQTVDTMVEQSPQSNVFALLDAAMHGKTGELKNRIREAKPVEDPYMLFGLFSSQLLQLAALVYAEGRSVDDIAKTLKTHPFPLKKLAPLAKNTSKQNLHRMIEDMAALDDQLKSTGVDPWLLLEQALLKIAAR